MTTTRARLGRLAACAAATLLFACAVQTVQAQTFPLLRTLNHPEPEDLDGFGSSVASTSQFLAVGAPYRIENGKLNAGAAYLMDVVSATRVFSYRNPDPQDYEYFGFRLGANNRRIMISEDGAILPNNIAGGAVHIFSASNGLRLFTINNPFPLEGGMFGFDTIAWGNNVMAGSQFQENANANSYGAAFLINPDRAQITRRIVNPITNTDTEFGVALARSLNRVLVGSPTASVGQTTAGIAYTVNVNKAQVDRVFFHPRADSNSEFGAAVAANLKFAAIGAPGDSNEANGAGAVYLFNIRTGQRVAILKNPTPDPGDAYGSALAFVGPYLIVGAPYDDLGALNGGIVYVYDTRDLRLLIGFTSNGPTTNQNFGYSICRVGFSLFAVGAPGTQVSGVEAGSVFIYDAAN